VREWLWPSRSSRGELPSSASATRDRGQSPHPMLDGNGVGGSTHYPAERAPLPARATSRLPLAYGGPRPYYARRACDRVHERPVAGPRRPSLMTTRRSGLGGIRSPRPRRFDPAHCTTALSALQRLPRRAPRARPTRTVNPGRPRRPGPVGPDRRRAWSHRVGAELATGRALRCRTGASASSRRASCCSRFRLQNVRRRLLVRLGCRSLSARHMAHATPFVHCRFPVRRLNPSSTARGRSDVRCATSTPLLNRLAPRVQADRRVRPCIRRPSPGRGVEGVLHPTRSRWGPSTDAHLRDAALRAQPARHRPTARPLRGAGGAVKHRLG